MRVLFVNRFYWPETPATGQLLTDLAESLAARGHDVTVVTSRGDGTLRSEETHRGVRIRRVRGTRAGAGGVGRKAIDFATFYGQALWQVLRLSRRDTSIVALTD